MSENAFEPMSAREALLAIKFVKLGQEDLTAEPDFEQIIRLADAGLASRGMENFTTTDLLADALAQAHKVLREVREGTEMAVISGEIDEALVLSPILEAMIERRIGPKR